MFGLIVHFQNKFNFKLNTMFSGDSGYPLRPTLLTPIVETEPESPQRHYTELHCRVRNTVERCIGVLKSRWRCLLVDRKLHYHPTTAGLITNACTVLHNIANAARLPVEPLTPNQEHIENTLQVININVKANYLPNNGLVQTTARQATHRRILFRCT